MNHDDEDEYEVTHTTLTESEAEKIDVPTGDEVAMTFTKQRDKIALEAGVEPENVRLVAYKVIFAVTSGNLKDNLKKPGPRNELYCQIVAFADKYTEEILTKTEVM